MIGALILAAGQGRRMGQAKPAALLSGKPLIAHVADSVQASGLPPPLVVLGHEADAVAAALGGRAFEPVFAPDHALGMAHSMRAGIAAVPAGWSSVILCFADMPLIAPSLIRTLASQAAPHSIVVPQHKGRRGHPLCWGRDFFPALMALEGDTGARALLERYGTACVPVDWPDETIFADADTPADLRAMAAPLGRRQNL